MFLWAYCKRQVTLNAYTTRKGKVDGTLVCCMDSFLFFLTPLNPLTVPGACEFCSRDKCVLLTRSFTVRNSELGPLECNLGGHPTGILLYHVHTQCLLIREYFSTKLITRVLLDRNRVTASHVYHQCATYITHTDTL